MTEKATPLLKDLYRNRKLVLTLAKNDFKTKFAGSYLGIIWAFIQPVVTVLVYWFVFGLALRDPKADVNFPFVLWLVGGIVPWFFFQDALLSGTNSLLEYNYLVKKVVFNIRVLPVVKVLSAIYVHIFFVLFTIVLYAFYGYFPDLYYLQIIYYSLGVFVLVLGMCYLTSSVVVFFRDLSQIVGIFLQVGVWMTPIMWNIQNMALPGVVVFILKLNPLFYVVQGYRDALVDKIWFWERPEQTVYFWVFTLVVFFLGDKLFKRLKVHFADVL